MMKDSKKQDIEHDPCWTKFNFQFAAVYHKLFFDANARA